MTRAANWKRLVIERGYGVRWVTALLAVLTVVEVAPAQVSDLDVALFRTRRGADITVVDGVMQFDPQVAAGGEGCAYLVGFEVKDADGAALFQDSWRGLLACEEGQTQTQIQERRIRVVETFQFAFAPGEYLLEISVEPAGRPEAARRVGLETSSLAVDELTSDLILGRDVGWVDTTQTSRWTVRKGQVGIAADPYVVADADRSTLAYYLEIYQQPEGVLAGEVEGVIRRPNGEEVIRSRLAELEGSGESRPIAGAISVAGLPPGDYALEVELRLADTTVTRSRGFLMAASFDRPVVGVNQVADSLRSYFWSLSDDELVETFDAIEVWLATSQEQNTYRSLSPDGKRGFLLTYFLQVAPRTVGPAESALDEYLERVSYVNDTFGEKAGREQRMAWRTDRGRIYLVRGKPTDRIDRPFPSDATAPYEIWGYAVGSGYIYLFVDETRFGNYRLIFSTDPRENTLPQWQTRVGIGALEDLDRYYGVRPS